MRLYALSAGVEAPTKRFSGIIHSIFHHACNVSLDNDALLTLVSSEKGNLPQGIRLGTPSTFTFLNQLRVGQPVACRGGILRISGANLSVDLRTASPWHIDLKELRVNLHQHAHAQAWALAWRELETHRRGDGISAMIEAVPSPGQHAVTSTGVRTLVEGALQTVPALVDATRTLQVEAAVTAIKSLIGLGPGLTPSGDDFLVGYLAGLWGTASGDSARLRFLTSLGAWLSEAAAATNAISCSYIKSAVKGNVSEPVATLARQLEQAKTTAGLRAATQAALQVGYTSGTDGVLGLLLGCIPWTSPSLSFPSGQPWLLSINLSTRPHNAPNTHPKVPAQRCPGMELNCMQE